MLPSAHRDMPAACPLHARCMQLIMLQAVAAAGVVTTLPVTAL